MKKFEILGYFTRSISLLNSKDKRKYFSVAILQSFVSFLDLIGVGLVAIVVALSVTGVQSQEPTERIFEILKLLNLDSMTFQVQVAVIGSIASFFFILKTLLTMFISRKILFFLGRRSADSAAKRAGYPAQHDRLVPGGPAWLGSAGLGSELGKNLHPGLGLRAHRRRPAHQHL